jgi:hypothetical protein
MVREHGHFLGKITHSCVDSPIVGVFANVIRVSAKR